MRDRNVKRYNDLRQQTAHKSGSHHIPKNKLRVQLTAVAQPTLAPASPPIKDRLVGSVAQANRRHRRPPCQRAPRVSGVGCYPCLRRWRSHRPDCPGWWLSRSEWTNAGCLRCARKIRRWSSKSPPICLR